MSSGETLRDLISLRKGVRTYQDLADESGGTPGRSRWTDYATSELKNGLPADTVATVARVLGVSRKRVVLAVARQTGVDLSEDDSPLIEGMPEGTARLDQEEVEAFLTLIQVAVDRHEVPNVRHLRAARKSTGSEALGPRGGKRTNPRT